MSASHPRHNTLKLKPPKDSTVGSAILRRLKADASADLLAHTRGECDMRAPHLRLPVGLAGAKEQSGARPVFVILGASACPMIIRRLLTRTPPASLYPFTLVDLSTMLPASGGQPGDGFNDDGGIPERLDQA